ncbi:hypothetical protein DVA67_033325 [Solirubrobacter sp. CPCC 204708]|uniref:DUF4878 domain-containing protein n=1 Tax=Solirubrobacter deserti TaxID=2282478 RepID=A0ABT4RIZ9_9ACTN|nr:hypothetical protein [Solirubrobacter deserti]MBE2320887.1 hypothetical protein [Solirubrobacter deserti]MDA0138522.1 hypothetical protein [Solirubrobacter deserti]
MSSAPEPAPAPMYPPPPQQPPKRRTGRIILIVVSVVVVSFIALIAGLFLLVNESTEDAQKVSDELVTAVQAGDGAKVYSLTGPSFRAATNEQQTTELVDQVAPLVTKARKSPDGKAINSSTENGTIAVFTYTMDGTSGEPVYFKTQIRDEEGRWQVMNFRFAETELSTEIE